MLQLIVILVYVFTCESLQHREYSIRKDYFIGFKAGEFSVYDRTGTHLQYRIESRYSLVHTIELVAYPSKQVVAKLKGKWTLLVYEATLDILDSQSKKWVSGTIRQNFQLFGKKFIIDWNGRRLSMENTLLSRTTHFRDEQQDGLLMAQFSIGWGNKYDMQVFSNDLPDGIYLLSLAAKDKSKAKGGKG